MEFLWVYICVFVCMDVEMCAHDSVVANVVLVSLSCVGEGLCGGASCCCCALGHDVLLRKKYLEVRCKKDPKERYAGMMMTSNMEYGCVVALSTHISGISCDRGWHGSTEMFMVLWVHSHAALM